MMKGKKDKNKLVPVKKVITRGGKTFETTVYVRQGQINEHTKHKEQINVDEYAKNNWANINTVDDFMAARNKIFAEKDTSKREALRGEFIRHFESMGVTYNHCDTNSGVDWMRFMMRTKKMLANGDLSQEGVKEQKYMRLDAKKSKELVQACSKQVGNSELMKAIEEAGIDYKKSNNEGINRMRALMALREHIQDGKAFDLITDRELNPNFIDKKAELTEEKSKEESTRMTDEQIQEEVRKYKDLKLKKVFGNCLRRGMTIEKTDDGYKISGRGCTFNIKKGKTEDDKTKYDITTEVEGKNTLTDEDKKFSSSSRAYITNYVDFVLNELKIDEIKEEPKEDEGLTDEKWTVDNYKEPQIENAINLAVAYGFNVTKKGNTYTMSNGDITINIEKTTGVSGNAKFKFTASGSAIKDKFRKKELTKDGMYTEEEATWWTQTLFDKLGLDKKEDAKEEKPKEIPNVKYFDLDLKTAKLAHEMNSFRAFKDPTPDYKARVDALYEIVNNFPDEYKEEGLQRAEAFSKKLADWYNQYFSIEARMPSMLISGGGNFNCRKKEKQNAARDKHWERYNDIKAMAEKIKNIPKRKKSQKPQDVREELKQLEESQQRMKDANAYYRKHKTMVGFSGFSDFVNKNIDKAIQDGKLYKPFESFELTNNNAKIKRLREKVKLLDSLDGKTDEQTKAEYDTGGMFDVIENADANRIQLKFDGKPDLETRTLLKKNGFRWSPKNGVWQRQLTTNGKYATKRLIEQLKESKK